MDSTIYSEIRILIDILFGNILGNHLIGDIAGTAAEVSSCPQVPSPELFLQMRILRHQVECRLPFQPLQQAADRHLRGDCYEEMYRGLGHMPCDVLDLLLPEYNPDRNLHSLDHISTESRPSIFP